MLYITSVINEAILCGFIDELVRMLPGLLTLKVTYGSDASTVASVDMLAERIKNMSENYKGLVQSYN